MSCLIATISLAIAAAFNWGLSWLLVFAASKVFGFERNIWQILLVFVAIIVLGLIFKSGRGKKDD